MSDRLGAFRPGALVERGPLAAGPLSGLTFAVKDLFDVAGDVTGCGNPDWAASHPPARSDAWAVDALRRAGASLHGKAITDEISLGLLGINRHYGTPINPRAPDCVPGGSSSGSASAVAGGLVDFALGTDSGGSIRVPSSFCALYGLRPTHGRISVSGLMTQAPTFDTVGYFTRDAETFVRVGSVLLGEAPSDAPVPAILVAADAFALADLSVRDALAPWVQELRGLGPVTDIALAERDLLEWSRHQRVLQQAEFQATFRDWIDRVNPRFSAEVAGAFANDGRLSPADISEAKVFRAGATTGIEALLKGRHLLCLPTSPILPIRREAPLSAIRAAVHRIVDLTAIAGLAGLPQINLPLARADGVPVGLSLIGWRNGDTHLIGAARTLANRFAIDTPMIQARLDRRRGAHARRLCRPMAPLPDRNTNSTIDSRRSGGCRGADVNQIRIGMLTPSSNMVLEPALAVLAAGMPGLGIHISRFRVTEISLSPTGLDQFAADPMVAAAELLADAEVDAIAWNGTSASWLGFSRDEDLCRRITAATGVPATSASLAFREACRVLGIARIGLVTPYTTDVQDRIRSTWAEAGLPCTAERHLGLSHNFAFAEVSEQTISALVRAVAAEGCDAAAIVCTNLRGTAIAPALERELGMPVLDSVAVTLWSALRLIGADPGALASLGRIFAQIDEQTR